MRPAPALMATICLASLLVPAVGFAQSSDAHYRYSKVRVSTSAGHSRFAADLVRVTTAGEMIGTVDSGPQGSHAFIKPRHGKTIIINIAGFPATFADAASSNGTAVITAYKPLGEKERTYIRRPSGRLKRVNLPGADPSGWTVVAINNDLEMVALGFGSGAKHKCVVTRHGHFKPFALKRADAVDTYAEGINDHGTIVGSYADKHGVTHGFIDRDGQVRVIDLPRAGTKDGRGSQIQDISDNGIWVGAATIDDDNADSVAYVHRPGHSVVRVAYPGATKNTFLRTVDTTGTIVGAYTTAERRNVAFIARPR